MKLFDIDFWDEVLEAISRNKTRSFFTAMGVFWGITMLVFMAGFGNGAKRGVSDLFNEFAVNSVFFIAEQTDVAYGGFKKGRSWHFENADLDYVAAHCQGAKFAAGLVFVGSQNVVRGEKHDNFEVIGHTPMYRYIEPTGMMYGRHINQQDMDQRRKVCTIGKFIYETLFSPGENPVGQVIRVGSSYFTVIGVHIPLSQVQVTGENERAIIAPAITLQELYNMKDEFYVLAIAGLDGADSKKLQSDAETLIKVRHTISPDDKKAVRPINLGDEFSLIFNVMLGITILIWIVGAGTLLAGIVGISNIMLVVTRERTHEIGIRRALGATPGVIRRQIIAESFALTFVAGIAGIAFSVGILALIDNVMAQNAEPNSFFKSAQVSFSTVVTALLLLVGGGVAAGIIPSNKALEVSAVDAIREE